MGLLVEDTEGGGICKTGEEACGFYALGSSGQDEKRSLKWIPGWCECGNGEQCVFGSRTLQAYKHVCLPLAGLRSKFRIRL